MAAVLCRLGATFTGTLLWLAGGLVFTIYVVEVCGATPVVNCVVCDVTALPAMSVTPELVSVITVEGGSTSLGGICTSWLFWLKLMAPGTTVWFPPLTWMVVPFTVSGSIGALNSTRRLAFTGTLLSLSAGLTPATVTPVSRLVPV